jgi:hypothetical protein
MMLPMAIQCLPSLFFHTKKTKKKYNKLGTTDFSSGKLAVHKKKSNLVTNQRFYDLYLPKPNHFARKNLFFPREASGLASVGAAAGAARSLKWC